MSWFSRFFGNNNNGSTPNNQSSDDDINVMEDLFINNNPPAQPETPSAATNQSLKVYLEQDFFRKGFEDGYDGHSAELLDNKVMSIKADFRLNIKQWIDTANQEVLKLENHKVDMAGMSERLVKKIENQLIAIRANVTEMESEIAMSALDEGLVMVCINNYRDGFIRGAEAYQEEKLFAGSTGLFTNLK